MDSAAEQIVGRVLERVDEIEGLITIQASEGRVIALIADRAESARVRAALLEFGVPEELLDTLAVKDHWIQYPNDDPRLMEWLDRGTDRPGLERPRNRES